jgi:hypothetical protein
MRRTIARAQGIGYVLTAGWPLVHLRSFEAVTGKKVDDWLVRTVAGLLVTVGLAELDAARRDDVTPAVELIGIGSAATLGAVSAWYAARGRIRKVYLADAAFEAAVVFGWLVARRSDRRGLTAA